MKLQKFITHFFIFFIALFLYQVGVSRSFSVSAVETSTIETLTTRYRNTSEVYRNKEREFAIAKQQYTQLQTLASLEAAVQATRNVFIQRNETLTVYLELLEAIIRESDDIDVQSKRKVLELLVLQIEALQRYRARIDTATDRVGVELLADQFDLLSEDVQRTIYMAQSIIVLSNIQSSYESARVLQSEITARIQLEERSSLQEAEQQRAFDEVERTLLKINNDITALSNEVHEDSFEHGASGYNVVLKKLVVPHTSLVRVQSFFEELAK